MLGWLSAIYQCHSGSHGITVSVSISVCQLVSLTGIYVCEAYTIWPWPCISPVSHTSVSRCLCVCAHVCVSVCIVSQNPEIPWYVGGISTIFPGHCCLCLARCVSKFPHREGDKHTHAATVIYKPHHGAAHTLYGEEFTATNCLNVWLGFSTDTLCPLKLTVAVCEPNLQNILLFNAKLDSWPSSEWVIPEIN